MKKHKKNGLVSKVMKLNKKFIIRDNHSRYIPYCDFGYHQGLIKDEKVCIQRKCKHYYKLYIKKELFPNFWEKEK